MEKKKKRKTSIAPTPTFSSIPPSPCEAAKNFGINTLLSIEENVQNFTTSIKLSPEQIQDIYNTTKEQSQCDTWRFLRQGRITASGFHRVMTRSRTLLSKPLENASSLLRELIERPHFETHATKHGINMEVHAAELVAKLLGKFHQKVSISYAGLVVSDTHPFLAVSPDLEVTCSCHEGEVFLVEIKSPYTVRHTAPTADNLDYLEIDNESGETHLKRNHPYYSQIQGQLAITGNKIAWFLVYTHFGHHLEKITFDEQNWENMKGFLISFWYEHLAPTLLKIK